MVTFDLPQWIRELARESYPRKTHRERMDFTILLSEKSVGRSEGGPFAATVYWHDELVGAATNQVLVSGLSIMHAEIIALTQAQAVVRGWDIELIDDLELYSSAEPCCQCYGALFWAGVQRLVFAAPRWAVESIGFDEGPKPADWIEKLYKYGIEVIDNLGSEPAIEVIRQYGREGRPLYGGFSTTPAESSEKQGISDKLS